MNIAGSFHRNQSVSTFPICNVKKPTTRIQIEAARSQDLAVRKLWCCSAAWCHLQTSLLEQYWGDYWFKISNTTEPQRNSKRRHGTKKSPLKTSSLGDVKTSSCTSVLYSGRFYNSVSRSSKSGVLGEKLKTCNSVRKSQYVSLTSTFCLQTGDFGILGGFKTAVPVCHLRSLWAQLKLCF